MVSRPPSPAVAAPLPYEPPLNADAWQAWLEAYQTGHWARIPEDQDQVEPKPSSSAAPVSSGNKADRSADPLLPQVIDDDTDDTTSAFDYFRRHGHLAPPKAPAKRLEKREEAVIRHDLRSPTSNDILDIYVQHAKDIFDADYGAVSMASLDRLRINIFSSSGCGLEDLSCITTSTSICAHALLLEEECMVIRDRSKDWRFRGLPFAPHPDAGMDAPDGFQFYASAAILASAPHGAGKQEKVPIGRLCILSIKPRPEFGQKELERLKRIADMASRAVENAWQANRSTRVLKMQDATSRLAALLERESSALMSDGDSEAGSEVDFYSAVSQTLCETMGASATVCLDVSTFSAALGPMDRSRRSSAFDKLSIFAHIERRASLSMGKEPPPFAPVALSSSGVVGEQLAADLEGAEGRAAVFDWLVEREDADWAHSTVDQTNKDVHDPAPTSPSPLKVVVPDSTHTYISHVVLNAERTEPLFVFMVLFDEKTVVEDFDVDFVFSIGMILQSMVLRQRAVQSEKAKVAFIRQMSHELRTPLHGITGVASQLASILIDDAPPSEKARLEMSWLAKAILSAGRDLHKAINDLIDVNDLTAPVVDNVAGADDNSSSGIDVTLDLTALVETMSWQELQWASSRPGAPIKSPLLVVRRAAQAAANKPMLKPKDANYVRKIVQQIVSNAFRFCRETDAAVDVCIGQPQSNGATAVSADVVVRDNGIGMSADFVRESYRRPFNKACVFKQGTGLGVALADLLLQEIGGNMEVESATGQGTTVKITVPLDGQFREGACTPLDGEVGTEPQVLPLPCLAYFEARFFSYPGSALADVVHRYCKAALSACGIAMTNEAEDATLLLVPVDEVAQDADFATFVLANQQPKVVVLDLCQEKEEVSSAADALLALLRNAGRSRLHLRPPLFVETEQSLVSFALAAPTDSVETSSDSSGAREEAGAADEELLQPTLVRETMLSPASSSDTCLTPPLSVLELSQPSSLPPTSGMETGSKLAASGGAWASSRPFSVLLVEDNPLNMRLLRATVQKVGCVFEEAENGQEAVDKFKESTPAVVLLDISLPIMDGFDACKLMRSHWDEVCPDASAKRRPRIVAISALSTASDIARGIDECGMDEWRVKPANLAQLRKDLIKWRQEHEAASADLVVSVNPTTELDAVEVVSVPALL